MNLSGQTIYAPKKVYMSKEVSCQENGEDIPQDSCHIGFNPDDGNFDYVTFTDFYDQFSSIQSMYEQTNFQNAEIKSSTPTLQLGEFTHNFFGSHDQVVGNNANPEQNIERTSSLDNLQGLSPNLPFNFSENSIGLLNSDFDSNSVSGQLTSSSSSSESVRPDSHCVSNNAVKNHNLETVLSSSCSTMKEKYCINMQKLTDRNFRERFRVDINALKFYEGNSKTVAINKKFNKSGIDTSLQDVNSTRIDDANCDTKHMDTSNHPPSSFSYCTTSAATACSSGNVVMSAISGGSTEVMVSHSENKVTSSCLDVANTLADGDQPVSVNIDTDTSSSHQQSQIPDTSSDAKCQITGVDGDGILCQVCGYKAAGFYCGAFICEACKKFFMRACKQKNMKYICLRTKQCSITRESRVQCQYCRYQKCLSLNMYCPGSGRGNKNEKLIGDIPCRVCGAPSSGFHFGALTCEGCKGFFRRMAKERETKRYQCSKSGSCEISMVTRNICKSCRFKRCLGAGMSIEGSRIGRQSNSIKHAISLELELKKSKGDTIVNDGIVIVKDDFTEHDQNMLSQVKKDSHKPELPPLDLEAEIKREPPSVERKETEVKNECKLDVVLSQLREGNRHLKALNDVPQVEGIRDVFKWTDAQTVWNTIMDQFEWNARCIIKFSKKVPSFRTLAMEDQIKLIQHEIYPLVVLNMSREFEIKTKKINYFNYTQAEMKFIFEYFPMLQVLPEHFLHCGTITKYLEFSDIEYTFISALLLLNSDTPSLQNPERVAELQSAIMQAVTEYEEINHPDGGTRVGVLVMRLAELQFISVQHKEAISQLLKKHSDLTTPQLYKETFGKYNIFTLPDFFSKKLLGNGIHSPSVTLSSQTRAGVLVNQETCREYTKVAQIEPRCNITYRCQITGGNMEIS